MEFNLAICRITLLRWCYIYCWTPLTLKMSRLKRVPWAHVCEILCCAEHLGWPRTHRKGLTCPPDQGMHHVPHHQAGRIIRGATAFINCHPSMCHPSHLFQASMSLLFLADLWERHSSETQERIRGIGLERVGVHRDTDERLEVSTGKRSQPLQLFSAGCQSLQGSIFNTNCIPGDFG